MPAQAYQLAAWHLALKLLKEEFRVTFSKNDTKSSNLIFDPLRFCLCLVKVLVLVRKIPKLNSIGHVRTFRVMGPSSLP